MTKNAIRKSGFALLWFCFVIYAFVYAPSPQPDTFETILKLSSGQWADLNPVIVALFNLMGIWPMIYGCLMLIDGVGQKTPAWPFVTASFAVGAFAVLPYLALRETSCAFEGEKTKLLKVVDSPWTGRVIALGSVVLLSYGFLNGDWSNFAQQWRTSQFIHVMSLDFCMLCAAVSPLVKADMIKRDMDSPALFWGATLVPLLGVVFYLAVRPSLEAAAAASETSTVTGVTS
ncbi:MAG: DUF2834 domain-containing protein [Cyanobacteria bacterium P01_F01_bin.3]